MLAQKAVVKTNSDVVAANLSTFECAEIMPVHRKDYSVCTEIF